jgi:fatty-acyl-CoA synthase
VIPFSEWLISWAQAAPDKAAIFFADQQISYSRLMSRIDRLAAVLDREFNIRQGDRVAWLGNNNPLVIEALFACARIGAILVPLNWRLAVPELKHVIDDAGVRLLIVGDDQLKAAVAITAQSGNCQPVRTYPGKPTDSRSDLWPVVQDLLDQVREPGTDQSDRSDSPVLILYTAGTTGQPKGVVLTQAALAWSARNSVAMHDMTADDRILMVLPMFHAGGFNIQTLSALSVGASVYLEEVFEPGSMLQQIAQCKPTLTGLVPAQIQAMVAHPGWAETDVSCLRSVTTGSTFVPEACMDVWLERGVTALQVYGATETCAVAIHQNYENAAATRGSIGYAAENCQIRIVDDVSHEVAAGKHGVILIKGPNLFIEYWRNPSATAEVLKDGWFHTGDIGFQRPDGSYVISGRQADLIISGGENIYPAELEMILNEHPEIVEAAVIGLADDRWGEVPVAVIVKARGSELDQEAVLGLFRDRLARFKWPKRVMMVDGLPRNAMGKVQGFELRQLISRHRES